MKIVDMDSHGLFEKERVGIVVSIEGLFVSGCLRTHLVPEKEMPETNTSFVNQILIRVS